MESQLKHIVLMNSTRSWGGGEKWHLETALQLVKHGIHVTVVCYPKSELHQRCLKSGIKIQLLAIRNWSYLDILKIHAFSEWLKLVHPTAIIFNSSTDFKFGGIAARMAGIPQVLYRRGSAIALKNHFINRLIFKNAITGVIANSEETARTINQNFHFISQDKIHVIYNGIDWEKLDDGSARQLYVREGEGLILGNAGRFAPQKNHADLIRMAKILDNQGILFKLLLAGSGSLEAGLKNQVAELNLVDKVVFLDFVDDIGAFYRSIDVFVLSSKWEGFGYVLAEALYFEKPVVAYRVSSNPEIVLDKKTGILVEPGNVELLADAIIHLYQHKDLTISMGKAGKLDVYRRFSREKSFNQLLEILK